MHIKKWVYKKTDESLVKRLAEDTNCGKLFAHIAVSRGINNKEQLNSFFENNAKLGDPFTLCDMDKAVERIKRAFEKGEHITVFGDYDCDGVTATALLYSYISERHGNVDYYIPDRVSEGYGMNEDAVKILKDRGTELIITVDNGINAIKEVDTANSLGIDTVVTDHHLPQRDLPLAVAVIDPHRNDETSEYKYLSGVGVAFKLITAIEGESERLLSRYAEIITLGIIGDIVPLIGENRAICKLGIKYINESPSAGVSALKKHAITTPKTLNAGNISFMLVPRINAAGRMGDSKRAVRLLLENDENEAFLIADELEFDNSERQKICEKTYSQANEKIRTENRTNDEVIVLFDENWHSGIVGIVASRIVEKYGKPAILLSSDGEYLHGSGRSVEGVNLFRLISDSSEMLVGFGGHELAAGVTLKRSDLDDFCKMINKVAKEIPHEPQKLYIDCDVMPDDITMPFCKSLKALEPYGTCNEVPIFSMRRVKIEDIISLKSGKYVKLILQSGDRKFVGLVFSYGISDFPFTVGRMTDIAFTLEYNTFMGKEQISLMIKEIRPAGMTEDYYNSYIAYEKYKKGIASSEDIKLIYPDREDFKELFIYLRRMNVPLTREIIECRLHKLGNGKISVILEAFSQLGVFTYSDEKFSIDTTASKVSLEDAEILKEINNYSEKR